MAEDEEGSEHEGSGSPQLIPIETQEAFDTMMTDSVTKKVLCVAWIVPGDKNCDAAMPFLRDLGENPQFAPALVLVVNPATLTDLAKKNELSAVPTFQFYWKELKFTFTGTNPDKFRAYLAKTIGIYQEERDALRYLLRDAPCEQIAAGGKFDIEGPQFSLGFGWSPPESETPLQIEVLAFLLNESDKVPSDAFITYYNNPVDVTGSFQHSVPQTKEEPDQDDCVMVVNLETVPEDIITINLVTVIMKAEEREQNFEQVNNLYVRAFDANEKKGIWKYAVEGGSGSTLVVGKLLRIDANVWEFNAAAEGSEGSFEDCFVKYQEVKKKKKK